MGDNGTTLVKTQNSLDVPTDTVNRFYDVRASISGTDRLSAISVANYCTRKLPYTEDRNEMMEYATAIGINIGDELGEDNEAEEFAEEIVRHIDGYQKDTLELIKEAIFNSSGYGKINSVNLSSVEDNLKYGIEIGIQKKEV